MGNHSECGDASFEAWKGKEDEIVDQTLLDDHLDSGDYNVRRTSLAFSHYAKAFTYVCENQETSIARRLAVLHYMRGKELHSHYNNTLTSESDRKLDNDRSLIDYHLTQAMIQFQRAWNYGAAECQEWREDLEAEWLSCANLIWIHHCNHHENSEQSFSARIRRLEVLCKRTEGYYSGFFYYWLAKKVLKKATKLQTEGNYRQSTQLIRDNQLHIEEAKMTSNPCYIQELETKSEELLNVADSWDALQKGDACWKSPFISLDESLSKRIETEEPKDLANFLEAVDWYKTAISLARLGKSPESEAKAQVQLGRLYETTERGKSFEHYEMAQKLAIQINATESEEWYRLCLRGLRRHEKHRQWEANKDRERLRVPIRKELSVHLVELKHFDLRPAQQLLDLIYSKYPPKSPGLRKPEDTSMRIKLKKALLHYHPDKQDVDRFGLHWMVLAEEITVLLTRKFAYFKA